MMMMEEKLVINELEQGKELANRLLNNLKHTSSVDSNETLISEILRIYQNAIFLLSLKDDKNSPEEIDGKDSKNVFKKRKISEKKTETVKVFVGTESEKSCVEDGYFWRKYGQKEIHGSQNPRGYFRCTHRFTQNCVAVKQVQKSDVDPSIIEVKYLGNHTCKSTSPKKTTTDFSVSEQLEDIKLKKFEETMMNLEDLEKKKDIFRTFSFSNQEIDKSCIFLEKLSPERSMSGITSEIAPVPAFVEDSETVDSYFSSLENIIDLGQDWL